MNKALALLPVVLTIGTAEADTLFYEPFDYPNGALTNASSLWTHHSGGGPGLDLNVSDGQVFIDQNDASGGRGDANRLLGVSFDPATDNSTKLYAGFTVNFTALPFNTGTSVNGSYFAHFKSSAANEFYGRIGASTNGAAPGAFRIAVGNEAGFSSANPTYFPLDLNLNTTYLVVARLDLATDQTTLWIDPADESSSNVTATDTITYAAGGLINSYALRQGTSGSTGAPGDLYVDNLRLATTFAEAVPEPSAFALVLLGSLAWVVSRRLV